MISVISSNSIHGHLEQLQEWYIAEWEEIDFYKGATDGLTVPSPLLALDDRELLGGLTFSRYLAPGSLEIGLWINALLVAPKHRGNGIASLLIQAAEGESANIEAKELFAKTDIPEMYLKLGWINVASNSEGEVLKKVLLNSENST